MPQCSVCQNLEICATSPCVPLHNGTCLIRSAATKSESPRMSSIRSEPVLTGHPPAAALNPSLLAL